MIESERERGALRGTVIYPVRTARLLIRPLGEDDVDDLVAYRGRSDVCRWVPFEPMSRSEVLHRIRSAGDGQLTASGEIGYIFHPDYAGRGFATEAVRTLLDIALGTYGLPGHRSDRHA